MKNEFSQKVIEIVKSIPYGKIASYGQIAIMADRPRSARQVGWILNKKGGEEGVPWWRVINNSGRISIKYSEFLAHDQKELLQKEGIKVSNLFEIDIEKYRWRPFDH